MFSTTLAPTVGHFKESELFDRVSNRWGVSLCDNGGTLLCGTELKFHADRCRGPNGSVALAQRIRSACDPLITNQVGCKGPDTRSRGASAACRLKSIMLARTHLQKVAKPKTGPAPQDMGVGGS